MGPAFEATEESPGKTAAEEADVGQHDVGNSQPEAMPNSIAGDAAEAVDGATED